MLGCLGYCVVAVLIGVVMVAVYRRYGRNQIVTRTLSSAGKRLEASLKNLEFQFDLTYGGLLDQIPGLKGHAAFAMLSFLVFLTFIVL